MTSAAVIDLETTGFDATKDKIVEAAAYWLNLSTLPACRMDHWAELFNPGIPIPAEASAVHHLTDEHVRYKPATPQPDWWVNYLGGADVLVAHNAAFDRSFLPDIGKPWICTWRVALHLWPEAPRHSLQVLRYWLKLDPATGGDAPHRAGYDAACAVELLHKEIETVDGGWAELVALSETPVVLYRVTFGKHKDQLWSEVPKDYLEWILGPRGIKDNVDVIHTARHYLDG